jgi:hypothetical protein
MLLWMSVTFVGARGPVSRKADRVIFLYILWDYKSRLLWEARG